MANWERNRHDRDDFDRSTQRSNRGDFREELSGGREFYGSENQRSDRGGFSSGRERQNRSAGEGWNDSEQFTGQTRHNQYTGGNRTWNDEDDYDRGFSTRNDYPGESSYDRPFGRSGQNDYQNEMFASPGGAPYGTQPDQRPLGAYGGYRSEQGTEGRPRSGARFRSSTDLSSNYQGHYGQSRFGSVGDVSGFGTGSSIIGSSNIPSYGRTTSERNMTQGTTGFDRDTTPQSYRGIGPKGFQRSDERIREMVSETLEDHDAIDATDIEVNVSGGEVTLTGTVPNRHMKRLSEDVIEFLPGVRDVTNSLKVNKGLFGRVADSIQHALGNDETEDESRSGSRGTTSRGTSRSRR